MGLIDETIDISNKIGALNDQKSDLNNKIKKIDKAEKELNSAVSFYSQNRSDSVPFIKQGFERMYNVSDDGTEGTIRTSYEEIADFEKNVLEVIDENMQDYVPQIQNRVATMVIKRDEYRQRISEINSEIDSLQSELLSAVTKSLIGKGTH